MDSENKKLNAWMISTFILAGAIVGFGVAQLPYSQWMGTATVTQVDKPVPDQGVVKDTPLSADQTSKLPDVGFVYGNADAPITVVEFTDYQCSFCAKFARTIFPSIEDNYVKTGKVKFVYRNFPLDFHQDAPAAAVAAECAKEQSKYKEMHDVLFEKQTEWAGSGNATKLIKGYAKTVGLDTKQFDACFDGQKTAAIVRKDMIDGASVGVNGTPAFFVNGKILSGALPYEIFFKPAFDAELAGKKWNVLYNAQGYPLSVKVED